MTYMTYLCPWMCKYIENLGSIFQLIQISNIFMDFRSKILYQFHGFADDREPKKTKALK